MKRAILEAVFPCAIGEYSESEFTEGGWKAEIDGGDMAWRVGVLYGDFFATQFQCLKPKQISDIPIKAIHLISKYENQSK